MPPFRPPSPPLPSLPPSSLSFPQWFPYNWKFQWIYVIYRWILPAYFFGWLVHSGLTWGASSYFIYLTNWSFLIWNAYLILAAISVTFYYFYTLFRSCVFETDTSQSVKYSFDIDVEAAFSVGCCGVSNDESTWYQKIQWFLFLISTEAAVAVTILYWALLYDGGSVDGINANTHLVNGIFAVVDLWLSGVPVRLLHFIYISLFGAAYVIFSGIYHAAGTDPIYDVLDYRLHPTSASLIAVLVALLFLPFVHVLLYLMYVARFWIVYSINQCCGLHGSRERADKQASEMQ